MCGGKNIGIIRATVRSVSVRKYHGYLCYTQLHYDRSGVDCRFSHPRVCDVTTHNTRITVDFDRLTWWYVEIFIFEKNSCKYSMSINHGLSHGTTRRDTEIARDTSRFERARTRRNVVPFLKNNPPPRSRRKPW